MILRFSFYVRSCNTLKITNLLKISLYTKYRNELFLPIPLHVGNLSEY